MPRAEEQLGAASLAARLAQLGAASSLAANRGAARGRVARRELAAAPGGVARREAVIALVEEITIAPEDGPRIVWRDMSALAAAFARGVLPSLNEASEDEAASEAGEASGTVDELFLNAAPIHVDIRVGAPITVGVKRGI
jgi:hypothetical protein